MRRRAIFAVCATLVVSSLVPGPGGGASAAATFRFFGSGYGHGLGMSQWGAYGLAQMGWRDERILEHFYRGASVRRNRALPPRIRVELSSGRSVMHLTAQGGRVRIWEGKAREGELVGTIRRGETWTVAAKRRVYAVRDAEGAPAGGQRWGSPTVPLLLTYADTGARVKIQEAEGRTYGRGTIEFNLYHCGDGPCDQRAIARLSLDQYLYGLGEVPSSWPMQSLRAQAIAGRSYAVFGMRRSGLRPSCNCHIGDTANDQVYVGYSKESGIDGDRWVAAVEGTHGDVIMYRGSVIQAFYAASDGGHSENVEDVWHGGNPAYAVRWLSGVCDPGESTTANPWTDWSRSFSASSVTSRLSPYTGGIGTVRSFADVERGVSGRIVTATAKGSSGSATVTGSELRAALGLPDGRVWINSDRNIVGEIRERYDRLMCRPGLPASRQRAVPGGEQQFFDDGGLYLNTGEDTTVWLRGVIDSEYRRLDAGTGVLGLPMGGARAAGRERALCAGCKRVDFENGRIYVKPGLGARALWGDVLTTYLDNGGPGGALGFPRTSVRRTAQGGVKARFESGRIACQPAVACTVTLG